MELDKHPVTIKQMQSIFYTFDNAQPLNLKRQLAQYQENMLKQGIR